MTQADTTEATMEIADLPVLAIEDPAFWQDIHTPIQAALAKARVARTADGGLWLMGNAEVDRCLKDHSFLAADLLAMMGLSSGPVWEWWSRMMFSNNAPIHTRIRRLVSGAFTPRRVERERAQIRQMADDLIREALARGEVDIMETVAHHLPSKVMAHLLAIPEGDRENFAHWTTDIGLAFGAVGDPAVNARVESALANLDTYVSALVDQRRTDPGEDLLSELVRIEQGGDRLSTRELVDLVENLLFAGHDTTRGAIGAMFWLLIDNPDSERTVRTDPSVIPNAVEEILRYEAITFSTSRTASVDVTVGGVAIPAGTPVGFCLPAASRDPLRYTDPMAFDVRRPDPEPPTFGAGPHYCIGAALSRIELQEMLRSIVENTSRLETAAEPQWTPFAYIRRYDRLDVTLHG
jgi:cytochrome P450